MTVTQAISEQILNAIAATGSISQGYDRVMGEGAYQALAGELYDALRSQA